MTFTTGASFDPKLQILHNVSLNSMNVSKIENEYGTQVIDGLEDSVIKEMFRPRQTTCVDVSLNFQPESDLVEIISRPSPFKQNCINNLEWAFLLVVPMFLFGMISLLTLLLVMSAQFKISFLEKSDFAQKLKNSLGLHSYMAEFLTFTIAEETQKDDFHRDPLIKNLIQEDLIDGLSSLKEEKFWIKKRKSESENIISEEPRKTEPLSQFEAEILSNIFESNKK
ncbi:unnamed protein product [Oikopleura dioica]|uniref:Uncharacterized protein n=1 Tax=Oikopleura dioica TaxID=34765 RepID=E4XI55_OIKDI|nr:unnamed protein product [Oikopleura dioica]